MTLRQRLHAILDGAAMVFDLGGVYGPPRRVRLPPRNPSGWASDMSKVWGDVARALAETRLPR